jgi:hypothetical protein
MKAVGSPNCANVLNGLNWILADRTAYGAITVGAMTDSYTPSDPTDDGAASFSYAGPTYEGFMGRML